MNFWLLLFNIGFLSTLTNGHLQKRQALGKIQILNYPKCTPPARNVIATPTVRFGQNVTRGFYPWHSTIFRYEGSVSEYLCGGTLISVGTVLTAAHCLYEGREGNSILRPSVLLVRLDVSTLNVDGEPFRVHNIIPHESYNEQNFHHDIALLQLRTRVTFNRFIRPACLTNKNFNIFDVVGFVVGFGETTELNEASMPGRSHKECRLNNRNFFDNYVVQDFSFCAGNVNGTTISKGDSGGGLVFEHLNVIYVRGIVSLAASSRRAGIDATKFSLFTDVQPHYSWIVKNMERNEIEESDANFCTEPVGLPLNSDGSSRKGSYPWHVAVYNNEQIAGGTIITNDIILTTSFVANWNNLIVEVQGQIITVKATRTYNNIDKDTICLLKLRESIAFNNLVKTACFINKDMEFQTISPVWIPSYTRSNNKLNVKDVKIFKSDLLNYSNEDGSAETENFINIGTGLIVEFSNGYYLTGFTTFPYSYSGVVSLRFISYNYYYDWIQATIQELN